LTTGAPEKIKLLFHIASLTHQPSHPQGYNSSTNPTSRCSVSLDINCRFAVNLSFTLFGQLRSIVSRELKTKAIEINQKLLFFITPVRVDV
tara:strand:+ start:603 stop:875 length:273 start_codon:yes stop_codon:yes gene_type:complete